MDCNGSETFQVHCKDVAKHIKIWNIKIGVAQPLQKHFKAYQGPYYKQNIAKHFKCVAVKRNKTALGSSLSHTLVVAYSNQNGAILNVEWTISAKTIKFIPIVIQKSF